MCSVLQAANCLAFNLRTSAYAVVCDWRAELALWSFGFIVEKSQPRTSFVTFSAACGPDMPELLVILIAIVATAATTGCGARWRFGRIELCTFGRSQASIGLSDLLGSMLGSVSGCRGTALVAALARPAPADARQDGLPPAWLAAPPGGPHGSWFQALRGTTPS